MLEELLRALALLQHLDEMAEPPVGIRFGGRRPEPVERLARIGGILVERVGRDAPLGDLVHQPGADLHLDPHVMGADHGGMQRAVIVLLRRRDIVLEAAGNGAPGAVHDAKRPVALVGGSHQHPEAENVGELAKRQMLALHLAPDRERPFLAAMDLRLDAVLFQLDGQRLFDLAQHVAAFGVQLLQPLGDDPVGVGIEHLEGDVLEFVAHRLHAHAAGERRIDVHGFLGDADALFGIDVIEGAHVVQPVGELDQQHAHVARHGEQQLAQVFGLRRLLGDQIELGDLGEPVDQRGDLLAELLLDLLVRRLRVLDRVVQQGRGDGGIVELHLGEDGGDFERMIEIGLARGALLVAMRLHGIDIGAVEQILIRVGIVFHDPLDQLVLPHHAGSLRQKRPDARGPA